MRYIKTYNQLKTNEGFLDFIFKRGFPTDKERIQSICYDLGIRPHQIHEDGTVDVDGDIILENFEDGKLPLKFGTVHGNFDIRGYGRGRKKLSTLEGSPHTVDGNMRVMFFPKLSSLEGGPEYVGGKFIIIGCPITNLKGCPKRVRGIMNPYYGYMMSLTIMDTKITSLEGLPSVIEGGLDASNNLELHNPEGLNDVMIDEFYITNTPLSNLYLLFDNFDDFRRSLDHNYIVFENGKCKISRSRLADALDELDLPIPDSIPMYEYTK